ncbi:DNA internalization-related competence protein ComEC/Rec2 [Vreelandella jeotgali]|uniref:DNA internalization-related competence protein ComEC/Rec2 n=1 Tax=Vreelandella jeotgali TaxID=553386 RepID=UPI00034638F5|nr:DNA internalization-related competence protein ComEC/Rec2 [Halomonas jeotgali]
MSDSESAAASERRPVPGAALPLALAALTGVGIAASGCAQAYPALLPAGLVVVVLGACVAGRRWVVLAGMMLVAFGGVMQEDASRLPAGLSGADLDVDARVVSVDEASGMTRLMLDIERCESPTGLPDCGRVERVRVSVYHAITPRPGERWQMTLRLRPPRGFRNPESFDYGAWLWREGIHATGYVRREPAAQRLTAAGMAPRRRALAFLDRHVEEAMPRRWLAALTLGASGQLEQDDWDRLNATGTTHLVVISGLHVGLVASFGLLLARTTARWLTPRSWRMRVWPWWFAAACAVAYALLAGLSPPATRAMVMALAGLWALSGRHAPGAWQAWWLAVAVIVTGDPLAVWRPGFWLSFVAVAWLIVIWQGRARPVGVRGWLWALCRTQLLLAPVMAAAVLLTMGRVAPLAPLVNLLAVPWVSMVMVPLALLGWLMAPLAPVNGIIWWGFAQALSLLQWLLKLAASAAPLWEPSSAQAPWLAGALGVLALCWGLPAVSRGLRVLSLALVPLVVYAAPVADWPEGALRVRIYDVGQGQLVALETRDTLTLYDTGPRFTSGFMPLTTLWPPGRHFDRVIVSHSDNDHAGGVSALTQQYAVDQWLAPRQENIVAGQRACRRGQRWEENGVVFRHLWPPEGRNELSQNNRSCVLQVTAGEHRLLITGDAGVAAERRFLLDVDTPLDLLVAGHHGSDTSSGVQLVRALAPRHVVFSAGRDNRFQHPADDVVRRFRRRQSCLWSTAHDGALTVWLVPGDAPRVRAERDTARGGQC